MPDPTPDIVQPPNPEGPRPASDPGQRSGQAAITYAVATVFTYLVSIPLKFIPPDFAPDDTVMGALYLLVGAGAAAVVAYVVARSKNSEWKDTGQIPTGAKTLLG